MILTYYKHIRCESKLKGGSKRSELCVAEANGQNNDHVDFPITSRFYDIIIKATDKAGNEGKATCTVIVVPTNDEHSYKVPSKRQKVQARSKGKGSNPPHSPTNLVDEYDISQKRYKIGTFSHVWDFSMSEKITMPPTSAPTKYGKGKGTDKSAPSSVPSISSAPSISSPPSLVPSISSTPSSILKNGADQQRADNILAQGSVQSTLDSIHNWIISGVAGWTLFAISCVIHVLLFMRRKKDQKDPETDTDSSK
jgi:hypothetical protein